MTTNGADSLCDTLLAEGVDVCFANPGTSEMHFVAALDRKPQMRCVLGLFEGVVTGAADGYARMSDKPAATLLHTGPGLANGLANLHNARRARSPIVNIVGDHASYHLKHDAPLTSDIEGLARPMSSWIRRASVGTVSHDAAAAVSAAKADRGVATLILPADVAWSEAPSQIAPSFPTVADRTGRFDEAIPKEVIRLLKSGRKVALLAGGRALRASPMENISKIKEATGARLLLEQANSRIERGAGRVAAGRILYNIDAAVQDLQDIEVLILIDAKSPVAFFAYPGKPGTPLPTGCLVLNLSDSCDDPLAAISAIADLLGLRDQASRSIAPFLRPERMHGELNPLAIASSLGTLLPENAIICDEALTSGQHIYPMTSTAAPHDYLQITGGAIGIGMPLAAGAAIAAPDRKVLCLQADGSGMYTVQALWTHAREQLDIVTIIFANRSYAILHGELKNVGAGAPGRNARAMLDLDNPALDWVKLAGGMGVEARRVSTADDFHDMLAFALSRRGPYLIEASI